MKINKKGLNSIIASVLMILLVIVAVGVIWSYILPLFGSVEGEGSGVQDCLGTQLEVTGCDYSSCGLTGDDMGYVSGVGVKLAGDAGKLDGLSFTFKNPEGQFVSKNPIGDLPSPGGSEVVTVIIPPEASAPGEVMVGAVLDGNFCDPMSNQGVCRESSAGVGEGFCADINNDTIVDSNDFTAFLNAFGNSTSEADMDGNGVVENPDFLIFCGAFRSGDMSGCGN